MFISLLFLPTNIALADTRSFTIDSLLIDTSLNASGDLTVSEVYDYNFKGDFNGITRNINFNGSLGIENIEISKLDDSRSIPFTNDSKKQTIFLK